MFQTLSYEFTRDLQFSSNSTNFRQFSTINSLEFPIELTSLTRLASHFPRNSFVFDISVYVPKNR